MSEIELPRFHWEKVVGRMWEGDRGSSLPTFMKILLPVLLYRGLVSGSRVSCLRCVFLRQKDFKYSELRYGEIPQL